MIRTASIVGGLGLVLASACGGDISGTEYEGVLPLAPERDPAPVLKDFTSQQTCATCHPRQAEEWRRSAHAHAMEDPVFQALVTRAGEESPETRAFCLSCHSNVGSVASAIGDDVPFAQLDPLVMEGVTCESCHRVERVYRPSNAGHVLDPFAPIQGTVHAGPYSPFHETVKSPVIGAPELCASCHDVESGPVALEQPYAEWKDAPAQEEGFACIDCHMPKMYGESAPGYGLGQRPVRRHSFLGPGALLWLDEVPAAEARDIAHEVHEQLEKSVTIELLAPSAALPAARLPLRVVLTNRVAGHRFPTGSAFFREVWVHLRVTDATGASVYDSGQESPRHAEDPSPLWFSARLLDASGAPTLFPWRAAAIDNRSLAPLERREIDVTLDVPEWARGPLSATAQIEFRAFPSALLTELGLPAELAAPMDLAAASARIGVMGALED